MADAYDRSAETESSHDGPGSNKREFWIAVGLTVFLLVFGWRFTGLDFYSWFVSRLFLAPLAMLLGIPLVMFLIARSTRSVNFQSVYPSALTVALVGLLVVLVASARTAIIDSQNYRLNNCWVVEGNDNPGVSGSSRWVCAPGQEPYTWSGYDTSREEGSTRKCRQVSSDPSIWICETSVF